MTSYLLDANALIAMCLVEHDQHERVTDWAMTVERFALCPIVEGALTRFMIRLGESSSAPQHLLHSLYETRRFDFWPDSVSVKDIPLDHVRGHRQVTDAYLVALAASRGAQLATLDAALAREHVGTTLLIPR